MADAIKVVEGKIKFREGKKWKPRWCIIKKPSPVADQLQVLLYKDVSQAVKEEAKPKTIFTLEAFFGLDAGIAFDKELHVLAIICHKSTSLMAFEQREHMIQFEIKIRQSLGEEHQFPVTVVKAPSSSRLAKDQVRLVIHDLRFCLIAQTPPKILLSWNIEDLRRFGANDNKFCFEGGSRCGKGTGVFALQSEQAKDIEDIVQLASMGKMSNGHRRNLNRSSQVDLSSHLIADMLPTHSSSYIHHHPNSSSPQAPLPVTLNCCYDNQTGSAESEDWSWYKRHSVSVMDHHRIVASRDNVDHFIGIYDVPPNHAQLSTQAAARFSPVTDTENTYPLVNYTTLMLPIDVISRNNDDSFTFTWSQRAITSHSLPDGLMECAHPAKTVLRPRHGHEYVVIKRKAKMLTTSHLHSASGRVSTFDLEHNDTLSVLSSLSTPQNSPTFSTVEGPSKSIYPDLAFFQPTMSPCSTINPSCSALSNNDSGQREDVCAENIFFPVDLCGFSPPPSPFYPKSSPNQEVHYPIYVNQEFTSKHVQPSIRHVSSSSSQSSVSPTKTNVLSIMSSIFSPKPNSPFGDFPSSQQKKYHSLRHSDPDPGKFENFQLSIPMVIASEKDAMKNIQTSNKSSSDRVPRKEYEKFVSSSIISRRNQFAEDQRLAEAMSTSSSSQQLQVPTIKSSGYKNIDSLNAAAAAERSSASTEAISAKYLTLPRGLGLTYTSQVNSFSKAVSSQIDMTSNQLKPLSSCDPYSNSADTLPYHCDPPPPIRIRHISSSSSSSHSSSPCLTPVDSSDSPPSYYAPSPPYTPPAPPSTPPPPMVPPRHRLLPPAPLEVPTSPSENTSDSSDDEQELNYIEVDMTKASDEPAQHPPTVYFRPHKRPKKVKDSAKMRYVLIDHSATKALQQARQEHVQARDGTQVKSASQLNRINSAPASSKKKHFTFISRERKLSSGSVESC